MFKKKSLYGKSQKNLLTVKLFSSYKKNVFIFEHISLRSFLTYLNEGIKIETHLPTSKFRVGEQLTDKLF